VAAATALLLLASGVAVAQPPRDGLCEGMEGDALTRCLYSDLDDRLRALEPTPSPTPTPTPSASHTPTPSPSATPNEVTVGTVTATSIEVKWTGTGATGYVVGRDGRDSTCTTACPWSTTDPASARSRTFDKLLAATEYTLFVQSVGGQRVEVKATTKTAASPTPTPTASPIPAPTSPTPTPTASGSWLSGASELKYVVDGSFGTWRGSPVEIAGTWTNDERVYPFGPDIAGCGDCGRLRDWKGAVDVGIAPKTWNGWDAEVNGSKDAYWRATARALASARVGDGPTYIRPYYEFNGDWFDWSVRQGEEAKFKAAWERVEGIFAAEFPEAKMMLGTAASGGGARIKVANAYPNNVDALSIDFYNNWPWCNTQACFNQKIQTGAGPDNSLQPLRRLAAAKGDPVVISEWSNAAVNGTGGGGGDAPVFFDAFHKWLKANAGTGAGQVLADVQFNVPGYADRYELYPNNVMPQSTAKYRDLWKTN
jgi:hypothetical protein